MFQPLATESIGSDARDANGDSDSTSNEQVVIDTNKPDNRQVTIVSEVDVNAGSIKYKLNVHGVLSIVPTYSY